MFLQPPHPGDLALAGPAQRQMFGVENPDYQAWKSASLALALVVRTLNLASRTRERRLVSDFPWQGKGRESVWVTWGQRGEKWKALTRGYKS